VTICCLGSHRLPPSRWRRILMELFSCTDNNAQCSETEFLICKQNDLPFVSYTSKFNEGNATVLLLQCCPTCYSRQYISYMFEMHNYTLTFRAAHILVSRAPHILQNSSSTQKLHQAAYAMKISVVSFRVWCYQPSVHPEDGGTDTSIPDYIASQVTAQESIQSWPKECQVSQPLGPSDLLSEWLWDHSHCLLFTYSLNHICEAKLVSALKTPEL
jgi:hypothetical protein